MMRALAGLVLATAVLSAPMAAHAESAAARHCASDTTTRSSSPLKSAPSRV